MTEIRPISQAEYEAWRDELLALERPLLAFLEKYTDHPLFSNYNLFRHYKNDVHDACLRARAGALCWLDDHRAEDDTAEARLDRVREALK